VFEGYKIKKMRQKLEMQTLQRCLEMMETVGEPAREDPDIADWVVVGGSGETPISDAVTLDEVRNKCRDLYYNSPTGHGIIKTLVKFVVGRGIDVRPVAEDEGMRKLVQREWAKWRRREKFLFRQYELVRRTFRDGEAFIRFGTGTHGLTIRFLDPAKIKPDSNGEPSWGIRTDPDDVERVISYRYDDRDIPADEILHVKIGVDANIKRGLPFFWACHKRIKQYDSWLMDRLVLNKIRTAIALVRTHEGAGPSAITSFVEAQATGTVRKAEGTLRTKKLRPGTIIDVPGGVKYEFLSPNIDARDVRDDGRAILLTIAAGGGLAEYMVSADASNANYASTMVAESPAVKEFELWQALFADALLDIYEKWFEKARATGILPANATSEAMTEAPPLVSRDVFRFARGCQILFEAGIMSRQTWQQRAGLDPEVEDARMAAEPPGRELGRKKDDEKRPQDASPRKRDEGPSTRNSQGGVDADAPKP